MAALARQLAHRHDVTVLTSKAAGLPSMNVEDGVSVIRVPVFFRRHLAVANMPSMFAYLASGFVRGLLLARETEFDVINTHFVVPTGPLGQALARMCRIPNVLSVHGGDLFDPSKNSSPHRHAPLRAAVNRLLRGADGVVGQSRDTVRHVSSIYKVDRPVELIPLGIDRPPASVEASRASFGLSADAFVLVTVGRIVARKASTQLVDALAASRLPNAHLLVIGDGPDAGAVAQRARALGVHQRVHLLGQVTDSQKYAALSIADAFVTTSQHEGFGLVFLEAMAFGLPVVCYDRGGQTDFLTDEQTGFVVPLNDIDRFTQAILTLHADDDARERFRVRNLELVENFFIDTCAARYESVFEEVIAKRANSTARNRAVSSSP